MSAEAGKACPHSGSVCCAAQTAVEGEEEEEEQYTGLTDAGGVCDPLCSVDEMTSQEYEEVSKQEKSDLIKAVVLGTSISVVFALINLEWVEAHQVSRPATGRTIDACRFRPPHALGPSLCLPASRPCKSQFWHRQLWLSSCQNQCWHCQLWLSSCHKE